MSPFNNPSLRRARHLLLGLFLVTAFAACDTGDPDDSNGDPLSDVIAAVIVGGTEANLVSDPFPAEGDAAAPSVSGSEEIVRGGSVILTVQVPQGADRLLVGVSGDYDGYYRANVSSQSITLIVTSAADSDLDAFTLLIATEEDGEVSEAARVPLTVNTQAGTSDQLQVSLNWNAPVDLDLHLETPDGVDIYYGNDTDGTGGMLDLDSNAGCSLDRVDNENITWEAGSTPPSGEYIVRVDLWSACDQTAPIPFVVTVNRRGAVSTYSGTFQPSEADNGGAFDGRIITEFNF